MVPSQGIEPQTADYKAAVIPFNYKGINGAPGRTRTANIWFLRPAPLPIGLQAH